LPNWIWANQVVGTNTSLPYDIASDSNGNSFTCGYFIGSANFGTFNTYGSAQTGFLVKYDSMGVVQWVNIFPSTHVSFASRVKVDNQNNIILAGVFEESVIIGADTFYTNSIFNEQFFLVKYDQTGNILWARQSTGNASTFPESIDVDNTNNVYVAGSNTVPLSFGSIATNGLGMYIIKYDPLGTPDRLIELSNSYPFSININNENKIFYSGTLSDTTIVGNDTLFPLSYYEYINDTDSVLSISDELLFICYDSLGNALWDRLAKSKSSERPAKTSLDDFSNLYVCGEIRDTTDFWGTTVYPDYPAAYSNSYILRIDSAGNLIWFKSGQPISQYGRVILNDIACRNNFIYAIGFPWGTCTFANVNISSTSANANSLILKLDTAGNCLWPIIDNTNHARNEPKALTIDQNNDIIVAGFFEDSVHFGNNNLYSFGNSGIIMLTAKMSAIPLDILENTKAINDIKLFPNPTNSSFNVECRIQNAELKIYDITGREVFTTTLNSKHQILNPNLSSGVYFVKVTDGEKVFTQKLIIE
jgi:hypothetical protein